MKNVAILAIVIASSIAVIGFSLANAIPQQCLLKDEKAALDTFMSDWRTYLFTQLPPEIRNPIFDAYNELAKLPVCENMKGFVKKPLLVDTYTGSMAINATNLDEMEKIYERETFSRLLTDKLFKYYVLPFPESLKKPISTAVPSGSKDHYINILGIIETKVPNKYLVGFEVCARKTKILAPEIIIHTAEDEFEGSVHANIAPNSCFTTDTTVQTNDPDSIKIEFKKQQVGDTSLESLKAEIEALKKKAEREDRVIPTWIKNNAKWWSDGQIGDTDFVQGIQYLITQEIIKIPETKAGSGTSQEIPAWIRNNAKWWADGQISDDDFISGIQYLISNGIMKIK